MADINQEHRQLILQYRNQVDQAMNYLTEGNFRAYLKEIKMVDELAKRIHRIAPRKIDQ